MEQNEHYKLFSMTISMSSLLGKGEFTKHLKTQRAIITKSIGRTCGATKTCGTVSTCGTKWTQKRIQLQYKCPAH